MTNNFNLKALRPADRLVLPKTGVGLIQHHAIYIGMDNRGTRFYIENALGTGVQLVNENHLFKDGYKFTRIEPFKGNQEQRNVAVKLAQQLIGKQYDLFYFNCEHYANVIQHNISYSKQVTNGLWIGLFAVLVGIGLSK